MATFVEIINTDVTEVSNQIKNHDTAIVQEKGKTVLLENVGRFGVKCCIWCLFIGVKC